MLRCLTEKQDDIKSEACKKEVFYFERMEVRGGGGASSSTRLGVK